MTQDDANEGLASITECGREYRHIHVEIQDQMTERVYAETYDQYEDTLSKIRDYQKEARCKVKTLRVKEEGNLMTEEGRKERENNHREEERISKVKNSILVEESVFHDKVRIAVEDLSSESIPVLEKSCAKLDTLLDEYFGLLSRAKIAFGGKDFSEHQPHFEELIGGIGSGKVESV